MSTSQQEHSGELCPQCQSSLILKHYGRQSFWGCSAYPDCQYTRSTHEVTDFEPQVLEGQLCPKCQGQLVLKKGRYGFFIGCFCFPRCDYMLDPNDQQEEQERQIPCPQCQKGNLVLRAGRAGKAFYACDAFPKCRYSVNEEPIEQECPQCQWPILLKQPQGSGTSLRCPQKKCGYKEDKL